MFESFWGGLAHRLSVFRPRNQTPSDERAWVGGGGSHAGETVTEASALALSTVWACVNLISGTVGSLPLRVYRAADDGTMEAAEDHPLHRVLHDSPNADQTALDFWDGMAARIEMRGNAYARKVMSGDRVVSLVPVEPDAVVVRRLESGELQYTWSEDGRSFDLRSNQMLHIRGFGGSPLGGVSTMALARHSFGLATAAEKSAGGMFQNGLRPAGVLKFPEFLSVQNREIAENNMVRKFVGAANAGRPMVLEGGAEWMPLSLNPDDAQMLESRRFSVEDVCRWFAVPPYMIGHTERSTSWGTGLEQQVLAFQKFSLRRRLKRIEQAIQKQLISAADRAAGLAVKFDVEELLRGDSAARAAFYTAMMQNGVMTINEVRKRENLPPIEGGDVARMQMQNVPIDAPLPDPNATAPATPNDDDEEDDEA